MLYGPSQNLPNLFFRWSPFFFFQVGWLDLPTSLQSGILILTPPWSLYDLKQLSLEDQSDATTTSSAMSRLQNKPLPPNYICTHERRTIGSGLQRRRCWKGTRFVPFLWPSFFQFLQEYHYHRSRFYQYAGIRSVVRCPNVYVYITGNSTLFPFPSNLIYPSLHRCRSTKCPLSALPWSSKFDLPSCFTNLYESLTASLKEKMTLISIRWWNIDDWVNEFGKGVCWQTTKQKKLHTELLPTAHRKARPVFIYFFLHCLSFHDVNYVSSPFPMSPNFFHCHGPHTLADSSSSRRPPSTSLLCSRSPFTRMTWTWGAHVHFHMNWVTAFDSM